MAPSHASLFRIESVEPRLLLSADLVPQSALLGGIAASSSAWAIAVVEQLPAKPTQLFSFEVSPDATADNLRVGADMAPIRPIGFDRQFVQSALAGGSQAIGSGADSPNVDAVSKTIASFADWIIADQRAEGGNSADCQDRALAVGDIARVSATMATASGHVIDRKYTVVRVSMPPEAEAAIEHTASAPVYSDRLAEARQVANAPPRQAEGDCAMDPFNTVTKKISDLPAGALAVSYMAQRGGLGVSAVAGFDADRANDSIAMETPALSDLAASGAVSSEETSSAESGTCEV